MPPLLPMLAKRVDALPSGDGWIYEPKWDGFRALVFRDGDAIVLQSRDEKPLERYFPELLAPLRAQLPERCGLDGVMAKPASGGYEANKRVMLKVKHERECDCVVAGFRWHKNGDGTAVGSLLLGLFDDKGTLHHVGVSASFTAEKRRELVAFLA